MNTDFYQRMAGIYSRVTSLEVRLKMPQRRDLLVRQSTLNQSKVRVIEDHLIDPCPYITSVPSKLIGMSFGNITVSENDFLAEIPRTSPQDLFISKGTNERVNFIIDPPRAESGQIIYSNPTTKEISSGIKCRLIHLYDDDPIIWTLLLSREKD